MQHRQEDPHLLLPKGHAVVSLGQGWNSFFSFPLTNKNASPVCPIRLAVPDVSGVGSCKAAQPRGSSTALHNGRVHVTFPLALDCVTESFGDVLKFRLLQSQKEKPNSKTSGKKDNTGHVALGLFSNTCLYLYFVWGRLCINARPHVFFPSLSISLPGL